MEVPENTAKYGGTGSDTDAENAFSTAGLIF
jgi:hypothetical protein